MKTLSMSKPTLAALALLALPGLALAASQAQPATPKTEHKASAKAATTAHLVDLNSATLDELKALPGVGDAYAQKIVDNRPYKEKSDLMRKHVIPSSEYSKIKALVVAHQQ